MAYYANIRQGLDDAFEAELVAAISSLSNFAAYEVKFQGLRIYNLKRFPYCLYYLVDDAEATIEIQAVLHGAALFPEERSH